MLFEKPSINSEDIDALSEQFFQTYDLGKKYQLQLSDMQQMQTDAYKTLKLNYFPSQEEKE